VEAKIHRTESQLDTGLEGYILVLEFKQRSGQHGNIVHRYCALPSKQYRIEYAVDEDWNGNVIAY